MDSRAKFSFILFLCSLSLSLSSSIATTRISNCEIAKVSVELYYESLCPDSVKFILQNLNLIDLFDGGLFSIIDLRLVPYGNAKLGRDNSSITCQHGPAECLLNTVEACAINAWPELSGHFPFIYCVEDFVNKRKYTQWETCFEKLGLDPEPVYDCFSSGLGKKLELQYAAETDNLQPPHTYVPWVVVDGKTIYEDYDNFLNYVCEAYKGTSVPIACKAKSLSAI